MSVKIESDGATYEDALLKLHRCPDWIIRIVFIKEQYSRLHKAGCKVFINAYDGDDCKEKYFPDSESAVKFIAEFLKKHDEWVAEETVKNERSRSYP